VSYEVYYLIKFYSHLLYGETLHVRSWATQSHKDKEDVINIVTKAETLANNILKSDKTLVLFFF
jgi:hypothetical protein